MPTLNQLNEQFGIPNVVRFESGRGGLPMVAVGTPHAQAEIYLHGAHVAHFQPAGQRPVLWMSQKSLYEPGKPIRGGVPVIFPWFGPRAGDPKSPMHGLVRTQEWEVESARQDPDEAVTVTFSLCANDATRALWPHEFTLRLHVRVDQTLELALEAANTGTEPFNFEEALHTYFAVADVCKVKVSGLAGTQYYDKVDGFKQKAQDAEPIAITAETDRVYVKTRATCVIDDPVLSRRIQVAKENSEATVVWNPWIAKAKTMADFGDDEWPHMLCVETVNAMEHKVSLPPGQRHTMKALIRAVRR